MNDDEKLNYYLELYDISKKIINLNPFSHFNELDIITILLPHFEEPFYCNITGKNCDDKGIYIYYGFKAINNFLKCVTTKEMPKEQLIRYEENISMCISEEDELLDEELKYKEYSKVLFNNEEKFITFRDIEKGYAPFILEDNEIPILKDILENIYYAIKEYITKIKKIDFQKGNTLFRCYNSKKKEYETYEAELFLGKDIYNNVIINDNSLIKKLKNSNRIYCDLELDTIFMESMIEDKNFKRPIITRLLLLTNHNDFNVYFQKLITPKDDEIQEMVSALINFILQYGVPKLVYVRDEYTKSILFNLCRKLKIKINIREKLNSIDSIFQGLVG